MKTLVVVSGINEVPEKVKKVLHVISVNSWREVSGILSGRVQDIAMFWSEGIPVDRLLKSVEDFKGGLLVYTEAEVGSAMRSRFTRVLRSRRSIEWRELDKESSLGLLLKQTKRSMFGR